MKYTQYENVDKFLERLINEFDRNESINGLMYGISLRLKKNPLEYGQKPLLAVVEDNSTIHLAALMTLPYNLQIRAPGTFSEECVEVLSKGLMENGWTLPGVRADKDLAEFFAKTWKTLHGCQYKVSMEQLLHELRHVKTIEYSPGEMREANFQDIDRAVDWAQAFHRECFGENEPEGFIDHVKKRVMSGELFFWDHSGPVAMAARTRPTPNGESIALVYTPEEYRRSGYATSVVASLSLRILNDGKQFCCLYADAANPTSNSIYRKIGYAPVGIVVDINFEY